MDLKAVLGASPPVTDLRDATPDGLRRSAFVEAFAARTTVTELRDATPDGLRRSAFVEAFAVRTTVTELRDATPDGLRRSASKTFGTVLLTRPRKDGKVK